MGFDMVWCESSALRESNRGLAQLCQPDGREPPGLQYPSLHLRDQSLRIVTEVLGSDPLHVSVRHKTGQLTWEHKNGVQLIGKTVCLEDISSSLGEFENLTLILSTYSSQPVELKARIALIQNYIQATGSKVAEVSSTRPYVWTFIPPKTMQHTHVRVQVQSEDRHICGLISVSPLGCPYHDVEAEAQYNARWQTMLGHATIGVKLEGKFEHGFNIVALTRSHDGTCLASRRADTPLSSGKRVKTLRVEVLPEPDSIQLQVLIITGAVFGLIAGLCLISYFCQLPMEGQVIYKLQQIRKEKPEAYEAIQSSMFRYRVSQSPPPPPPLDSNRSDANHPGTDDVDGAIPSQTYSVESTLSQRSSRTVIELQAFTAEDEVDCRSLPYHQCANLTALSSKEVRIVGTQTLDSLIVESFKTFKRKKEASVRETKHDRNLMLDHMAIMYDKDIYPSSIKLKSSLYTWIIFLMGTFYTIPVVQLLLFNQNTSIFQGNLDVCYYNYRCKYAFMKIEDFNHFFSNIAYIGLGCLFLGMTKIRQTRFKELVRMRNFGQTYKVRRGVPEQYGIFYALGGAMIMEGILSACYHICPTKINFQFDTTFMYVLAILCFLKIYQFRHPDITTNAYIVFSFIGAALLLEVIGYYWDNFVFWLAFILFYLFIILSFIIHTYYYGRFAVLKRSWSDILKGRQLSGLRPARQIKFGLCVVVTVVNCALAVFFLHRRDPGISKYLLIILIGNMVIYILYYCGVKLHYWLILKQPNEKISPQCAIYLLLSLVFVGGGISLFTMSLKNSALSPAQSRDMNGPCAVLFFDYHDLWHFLSAAGLYTTFMMVMTLEDENLDTEWHNIHVF
ncbi:SID1 transmembrane family member 2-like [Tigriopus californicus]|uniref:SID1 transmembrane family member 2-like n=1 Tax=Tigriopus californicus TaxID=6832 RepID=UPI0027DA523A|nr:SID1 transmembrane family member 2-like [Tigriopus californicus]